MKPNFIEINQQTAYIHQNDNNSPYFTENLNLSLNDPITLKGQKFLLADLLSALIHYDEAWLVEHFDERGQLEMGCYLFKQLFAERSAIDLAGEETVVEVRICCEDENISRLPWMLLADQRIFLSTNHWSVSLAAHQRLQDCELPPSPKILIVAPQPDDWTTTEAEAHIQELQALLSAADVSYLDEAFCVVDNWDDFAAQMRSQPPDILYYYGHGTGDQYSTRLVFADENNTNSVNKRSIVK